MASFATLQVQGSLMRSQFLGQDYHLTRHHHLPLKQTSRKPNSSQLLQPRAEFNILKMMGGRGLCNGEIGIQQELERQVDNQPPPPPPLEEATEASSSEKEQLENSDGSAKLSTTTSDDSVVVVAVSEDAFEKEMMGLTGGFPGGEIGLIKFIQENPPPHKSATLFTLSL